MLGEFGLLPGLRSRLKEVPAGLRARHVAPLAPRTAWPPLVVVLAALTRRPNATSPVHDATADGAGGGRGSLRSSCLVRAGLHADLAIRDACRAVGRSPVSCEALHP